MLLFRKFVNVGTATFSSRILGLVREIMMAAVLATGPVADVFYTCFRFPNLFRALFAEGAFNIAFVPLYAKELGKSKKDAKQFSAQVFAVLASWLIAFTAIAVLLMPIIVAYVLAPGFADTPDKLNLSITMTKIMFPYMMFMSLAAMFAGILNCLQRYFIAAITPILLNVVLIAVLVIASYVGIEGQQFGIWLSVGVFIAGVLQMAVLFIGVKKTNMTFALVTPRMTPKVKKLMMLMAPAILTGGVLQINLLIGTIIATTQDGANALINYADRINQLPLGVIGIAVGVVLLPELTRALQKNNKKAAELQNRAMEFAFMLAVPAAVGLVVMPNEIVGLLYERGAFTSNTTISTAKILWVFATGLPAYILIKTMQPAFFARGDMKTPFVLACVMVAINASISIALFQQYGPVAIALGTSIAAWVHLAMTLGLLGIKNIFAPSSLCIKRMMVIIIAGVGMGLGLKWGLNIASPMIDNSLFFKEFIGVLGLIIGAGIGYFAILIAIASMLKDAEFIRQIKILR